MAAQRFDVIIVGAGQGGGPLASAFARAGRRTALIERAHVGGTCVNTGCTPTKTMIASGRVAYLARRAADYGVHTGDVSVDMARVRERKREMVASFREGSEASVSGVEGLELIRGEAAFIGERTLAVALNDGGSRELTSDTIVLDVGERPRPLDIPGADAVAVLNSTSVMELDVVPEHLIVVGGGVIGAEFSQLFRRLGAEVTVVQRSERLLGREDPDIAEAVADIFREDGITLHLNASPTRVDREDGAIRLTISSDDGETTVTGTHLLAAAGRVPNTDTLNLAATGLGTDDRGYIETDDRLETEVPGIHAIGDVRPGPKFTHISYDDYRILRANLIDGGSRSVKDRMEPYTVFIDPQLGRVGLSETEAKEQGVPFRVGQLPMTRSARARETAETRGTIKVLVDPDTERILGAAVLGIDGGEVMSMLQLAMMGDLPYTALRDGVFAHPNLAEDLNNVFGSFRDEG